MKNINLQLIFVFEFFHDECADDEAKKSEQIVDHTAQVFNNIFSFISELLKVLIINFLVRKCEYSVINFIRWYQIKI
jgi:hypothetical protein